MALIGHTTYREEIPHEPGEFIEFRHLTRSELKAARKARQRESLEMAREMGPELMGSLRSVDRDEVEAAAADPLNQYDDEALLCAAICGWSYADDVTPDAIDRLDERTARWALGVIGRICRITEESEADRKNA